MLYTYYNIMLGGYRVDKKLDQIRVSLSPKLKKEFVKLCDGKPLSFVLRKYVEDCVKKGKKI